MSRTAAQLATYAARRAARHCLDCAADLKPLIAWVKPRCPECHDNALERARKYNATEAGRARSRRHMARRYAAQKAAGLCVDCPRPAAPGRVRCEDHLAFHSEANAHHYDRKEATHG